MQIEIIAAEIKRETVNDGEGEWQEDRLYVEIDLSKIIEGNKGRNFGRAGDLNDKGVMRIQLLSFDVDETE
ncbi:hypothetical protein GCM10023310_70510 [Paenibacillus vulneris]|uniref:Uncharacterized protein n=1 Tax=Paenibacillus vulneris TaxID=1133364 RepID=A0ABW3UGZ4_9BACL